MTRTLFLAALVGVILPPAGAFAQVFQVVQSPPIEAEEETPERPSRLRLAATARADLGTRESSPGFEQLAVLRSDVPWSTYGVLFDYEYSAVDWLRIGASAGYEQTSDDADDLRGFDSKFEGVHLDLSITPTAVAGRGRFQFSGGLRVSAGVGYSSWTINDVSETGALIRIGGEADLGFLFGQFGFSFRFGYLFTQTTALGPANLRFDLSGLQGSLGFVVRL